MSQKKKAEDKIAKWSRLIARIWSVPVIVYSAMMLTGYFINWVTTGQADPYAVEDYPFIENLPPIFMFLATLGLGVAWRWEKIGAIINLSFCVATLPILLFHWPIQEGVRNVVPYIILMVVATPGVLFLWHWWRISSLSKRRFNLIKH